MWFRSGSKGAPDCKFARRSVFYIHQKMQSGFLCRHFFDDNNVEQASQIEVESCHKMSL